jgi:hypothetical protein
MKASYDFYKDMLETHSEIGYLLVVLVAMALFNVALGVTIAVYPTQDVYLVPGIDACGEVEVAWGAKPPPAMAIDLPQAAPSDARLNLEAGAAAARAEAERAADEQTPPVPAPAQADER